jgi:hypothetical protein
MRIVAALLIIAFTSGYASWWLDRLASIDAAEPANSAPAEEWVPLFDGKSLDGWKVTDFGGHGEVTAEDGQMVLEQGEPMTGVTIAEGAFAAKMPKINYELSLEAMRVSGDDFFCCLTFPVGKDPCSLVVGGWGGGVVGLSSLDGQDASENETTSFHTFNKKKWYKIRLRVTDRSIEAWIDDERVVNVATEDRTISIRLECERSKPLGFSTYNTTGALRNLKVRAIKPGADG